MNLNICVSQKLPKFTEINSKCPRNIFWWNALIVQEDLVELLLLLQTLSLCSAKFAHTWYSAILVRHRITLAWKRFAKKCVNLRQNSPKRPKKAKSLILPAKKVRQLDKGTLLPLVAVLTNIKYAVVVLNVQEHLVELLKLYSCNLFPLSLH